MACCVTCHKRVRLVITGRGRLLPVHVKLSGGTMAVRGASVRYLRGEDSTLQPGERYAIAHWEQSPACKPPRKRAQRAA